MSQHLKWIKVWTLTGPIQNLNPVFLFSHSEVDLLVCLKSTWAHKLTASLRVFWQSAELLCQVIQVLKLSWRKSKCFWSNVRWAFVFFLISSDFHLVNLPWCHSCPDSLSYCRIMDTDLNRVVAPVVEMSSAESLSHSLVSIWSPFKHTIISLR